MKYVVFKKRTLLIPVIVPECETHSSVSVEGGEPVSAGFFSIGTLGEINISDTESESLKLGPDKQRDARLLAALLLNMGIYSFLNID